ncbi:hypothetical protein KQH42_30530, partial [Streptomyces sp. CHA1]|uniref:hypothetical protein n=1 Tax=Streptomyces sp. CHA1 TaxID=2841663 RepID=UPI00209636C0
LPFRLQLDPLLEIALSAPLYLGIYAYLLLRLRTFKEDDLAIVSMVEKRTGIDLELIKRLLVRY